MGRVFPSEQIFKLEIPEPGAHARAGKYILERFDNEGGSGLSIDGAMVYGSTALGTASLRSDVDLFIAYNPGDADETLLKIRTILGDAEQIYHVPIESHALDTVSLRNPLRHSIDPLFAEELLAISDDLSMQEWVVGRPLDDLRYFKMTDRRVRGVAISYTAAKAKQFARAILAYRDTVDLATLQRALELPSAIGRKVIPATVAFGEASYDSADKKAMIRLAQKRLGKLFEAASWNWLGSDDPVGVFAALEHLDREYSALLDSAVNGLTSGSQYDKWLSENYLPALQAARAVSYDFGELVKRSWMVDPKNGEYVHSDEDAPFDDEYDELPPDDVY